MVQQGQIDHLLQETAVIQPPPSLVSQAFLQDQEAAYQRSIDDPDAFWAEVAGELEWFKPWTKVSQWDYPNFQWFLGAKCNITYNCLDRHLTQGRKNKAAFIWLGEDGSERVYTYGRLAQMVNRFANGLKSLGVVKGDRVVIYMPLTPEGAIAMLACARIGAIHSVVYAGFSVGALRGRILDAQAKVVITGDVGYRRGNKVDLGGKAPANHCRRNTWISTSCCPRAAFTARPRRWIRKTPSTSSTPAAPPASPRAWSTSTAATWWAPTTTSRPSGT